MVQPIHLACNRSPSQKQIELEKDKERVTVTGKVINSIRNLEIEFVGKVEILFLVVKSILPYIRDIMYSIKTKL